MAWRRPASMSAAARARCSAMSASARAWRSPSSCRARSRASSMMREASAEASVSRVSYSDWVRRASALAASAASRSALILSARASMALFTMGNPFHTMKASRIKKAAPPQMISSTSGRIGLGASTQSPRPSSNFSRSSLGPFSMVWRLP